MRLIAFPQWDKLTSLVRGHDGHETSPSATDSRLSAAGLWHNLRAMIVGAALVVGAEVFC